MTHLFRKLRNLVERPPQVDALPGFENRIEVLTSYAERASNYEEDLLGNLEEVVGQLMMLQHAMEQALDEGRDREALEYLRLAVRLRPQRELLEKEIRSFRAVAEDLIHRVTVLLDNLNEARQLARNGELNPAATYYLDATLNRITRYFVLLERVTIARHRALPERLTRQLLVVIDDRQLDLELARFILSRRKALRG